MAAAIDLLPVDLPAGGFKLFALGRWPTYVSAANLNHTVGSPQAASNSALTLPLSGALALPRGDEGRRWKRLKDKHKSVLLRFDCYHQVLPLSRQGAAVTGQSCR